MPVKLQGLSSRHTQSTRGFTFGDNSCEVRVGQLERKLSRPAPRGREWQPFTSNPRYYQ